MPHCLKSHGRSPWKSTTCLPIAEALQILGFAEPKDGAIKLNAAGRVFAQSDTEERKQLFREHLIRFVALAAHIRYVLDEREKHRAPRLGSSSNSKIL